MQHMDNAKKLYNDKTGSFSQKIQRKIKDINKLHFNDTAFDNLMRKRISKVLLVCSKYDSFILEEDGRIDEQIFNEYIGLNLRYPPHFIQASSAEEAYEIMEEENIDLFILMLNIAETNPFDFANELKEKYPNKPIVLLTPFSREVSLVLHKTDLSSIDYVFSWLGNADIMLAIIKLIEDRMNVEHDVNIVGVQTILLVEDSERIYSGILPNIFHIVFKQSLKFMTEGLNEHQKMLRMRGRPKILLARNLEEAIELYNKYKDNMLGIISDISFNSYGVMNKHAGIRFCELVKNDQKDIPILLQSSEPENEVHARSLKIGFLDKNAKAYQIDLKNFIINNFAFGDFVFRNPVTMKEVLRVSDLKELQERLFDIPSDSFSYHISHNHFSRWLNARAIFPIAAVFKVLTPEDFSNLEEVRTFIYDSITRYRMNKGRGVIADFYRDRFDEYLIFTRIGNGLLGGKARGLAFIDSLIKRNLMVDMYEDVIITIPRTVVLSTEVFDEFMDENNLYTIALSDAPDEEILAAFIKAKLPSRVSDDLKTFLKVVKKPIAIRSSSLLEDSHYQPFAGIYSTYMIANTSDDEKLMVDQLAMAIKGVYASVFYTDSKAYMRATKNVIDEEKMGVVLQEVCGRAYNNHFYPVISGVARSLNFYPISPEKPEEGIANIALGLGKYIVEGGQTLMFSPAYPKKILQLSSPNMTIKETQKHFYALDLNCESFHPSTDDSVNLIKYPIQQASADNTLRLVGSTYDYSDQIISDGDHEGGIKLVTFSNILKYNSFPLAEVLTNVLKTGHQEMGMPIEIEFAVDLDKPVGEPKIFYLLQIRPIVESQESSVVGIENIEESQTIISSQMVLGNGEINDVTDIIYVRPENFNPAENPEIVKSVEKLNQQFLDEEKNYILIGPGRWGSSDPWLGIPVKWSQISAARLIIESGLENYRIDPSQGTHFFQNLTSFRVGYFTINPFIKDGFYDLEFLNSVPAVYEDSYLRHVRFEKACVIKIDAKKNRGVVLK
jgi:hypothetical protein